METTELIESEIPLVAKWNVQLHEDEGSRPLSIEAAENVIVDGSGKIHIKG